MVELRLHGHMADLGYVIARPHWGQGFVSEAARVVVDWALVQQHIYRVWAVCDIDNAASARVLEKIGMQREGLLRRWIIHPNMSGRTTRLLVLCQGQITPSLSAHPESDRIKPN